MSNRYNPGSRSFLQAATSNASVLGLLTTLRQTLQRSESTVRSLSTAPSAIRGSDAARRLVSSYTNLTNRLQAYLQSPGNVSATALDALARDVNGFAGRSEQTVTHLDRVIRDCMGQVQNELLNLTGSLQPRLRLDDDFASKIKETRDTAKWYANISFTRHTTLQVLQAIPGMRKKKEEALHVVQTLNSTLSSGSMGFD